MTTQSPPTPPLERKSWLSRLPTSSVLGPLAALLVAIVFFSLQSDRFLTGQNFSLIFQQVMVVGVLAIGQTLIILTSGIDLSNGVIMALGQMVMAKLAVEAGLSPLLTIVIGLGVAALLGLLNGILVTQVRLPPFIVTLGMYNIVLALVQIYSKGQSVNNLPDGLTFFGQFFKIGNTNISYGVVLLLALYALVAYVLNATAPGRHLYAVGNNPEAARLNGIPTQRILLWVYTLAGLIYGIAAIVLLGRVGSGSATAGQTENLDSITAVVIGGISLFGGRGIIWGSLIGAVIVGVFRSGLTQMGLPSEAQTLVTGILVILAVAVDQWSRRKG